MAVNSNVMLITILALVCVMLAFFFIMRARNVEEKGHERYIIPAIIFGVLGIILLVIKLGLTRPVF